MRTAASTSLSIFAWTRCWLASGCALLFACTASSEDVRPPADELFFPSGLVVSPDETVLFVANANAELRYDSGSIAVVELATVSQVIADWVASKTVPAFCEPDPDHRETLVCDEPPLMRPDAAVRIGNFATDIALQDFNTSLRVLVPTRGDPSISWADFDGTRLACSERDETYELCDDDHRLTGVRNDPDLDSIPSEPYGVFAAGEFAVVTHLSRGAVTLVDSGPGRSAQIVDIKRDLFLADVFGTSAATGVAGRKMASTNEDIIYVGSRLENRIQTFSVGTLPLQRANPEDEVVLRPSYLLTSNFFFLNAVGNSSDTRGMTFAPGSERLYVVNRNPPTLQIIDTSADLATGGPRNVLTGASDICRQASWTTVLGEGPDERAYVTCFQDGQVYVVDPRGLSQVEDIITVGRGPYGISAARVHNQLFISNFLEDTIAVVDVAPGSPTRNRVVLRIGKPRAP